MTKPFKFDEGDEIPLGEDDVFDLLSQYGFVEKMVPNDSGACPGALYLSAEGRLVPSPSPCLIAWHIDVEGVDKKTWRFQVWDRGVCETHTAFFDTAYKKWAERMAAYKGVES